MWKRIVQLLPPRHRSIVSVQGLPVLSNKEAARFRYRIARVDSLLGGWTNASDSSKEVLSGKPVSLFVLERVAMSVDWGINGHDFLGPKPETGDRLQLCRKVKPLIDEGRDKAAKIVNEITVHDSLISEQDMLGKQSKIAWIMVVTAIASAVAAIASAIASFQNTGT